jgi:hypothetical protein
VKAKVISIKGQQLLPEVPPTLKELFTKDLVSLLTQQPQLPLPEIIDFLFTNYKIEK